MPYPNRITLTPAAETYLDQLAVDLHTGDVNLEQLPPSLLQLWALAYEAGRASVLPALEQAEHLADVYYFEASIRQPKPVGEYISWSDLQRRRQERERAAGGNYPGGPDLEAWNAA